MSSRRVELALQHKTADRVPTFFRRTAPEGMELSAEQQAYIDEVIDVGDYLRMEDPHREILRDGRLIQYDELGVGRVYTGLYWDIVEFPLAHMKEAEELDEYEWPGEIDPSRTALLRPKALAQIKAGKSVVAMGSWGGSTGIFEQAWYMRGLDNFLMDLLINTDFAEKLLDKQLEMHKKRWDMILHETGDLLDIVALGDDLAGQDRLLLSPQLYRDMVKDRHKELINHIKAQTSARIYYHSCGAVTPLVRDLIDIGVDILDPIQPSSVDPAQLKQEFGRELTFFGGVDVQKTLPFGTPEEVRTEVLRRFREMGENGGLILGPSHWIQIDTPWENIHAMYEAIKECRY